MKKALSLFLILLLLVRNAPAQPPAESAKSRNTVSYGSIGIGGLMRPKPSLTAEFGITALRKDNWGAALSFQIAAPTARNLPADYPVVQRLFGPPKSPPKDVLWILGVCAVRNFPSQNNTHLRWNIAAGPALVMVHRAHFTERSTSPYDRSYILEEKIEPTAGLQLALNGECRVNDAFSMGVGIWGNLNPDYPSLGVGLRMLFGKTRL